MTRNWCGRLFVPFLLLLCSCFVFAQAVSGSLDGTVLDTSGAAFPGASVTITDQDRGTIYRTKSNAAGNFSQTHLLAGNYEIKVESAGFAAFVANATVQVDASTSVNATIVPAGGRTEVTVTTETPVFIVDRAEIATTLSGREVQALPVLDRNLTNLVPVVPGAQLNSWQHGISENPQQGANVNVNGQSFTSNGFLLDGTENHSAILGIAVINPNLDSLQDFKISTSNYDAEFGSAAGALLEVTTKSGSNQIHGSLFEFLRNSAATAADPFTLQNPPLRWNQFGGSFGAPIRKDRIFVFADYQGTRRRTGGSLITTVPTQAERNGDLSSLLGPYICADGSVSTTNCANPAMVTTTEGANVEARAGMVFDPNTGDTATGAGRHVFTRNGLVNIVPVAAPIAKLLGNLPLPNFGSDIFNNFVSVTSQRFDSDQYDGRVDYNVNTTTHVFGRYSIADFNIFSPAAFGDIAGGPSAFGFSGRSVDRNQSLSAGFDHGFGPSLVTDARFGFYRYRVRVQPLGFGTTPAADAGLPGLNTGSLETSGMPEFFINGNGGFSFGYGIGVNGCRCPTRETENHFQWVNNWTKELTRHTIKFGFDFRRAQQQRTPSDSHPSGEIQFFDVSTANSTLDALAGGQASTGAGLASFFLGQPFYFGRFVLGNYYPGLRQTRLFLYAQDSWRVTPKLIINYGLRWEDYLPQSAAKPGGAGSFDPATGEVLAAGIGSVPLNLGVQAYNFAFAPRLGVAYRALPGTVIRTGFGRSFTPSGLGAVFGQSIDHNPPIVNAQSITASNFYRAAFNLLEGPPSVANVPVPASGRYPLPNGIAIYGFMNPPDSYRIPEVDFWNFTIQHQFQSDLALEIAYVGNVGRHQFVDLNRNQAIPGPVELDSRRPFFNRYGLTQPLYQNCNCDNSSYNALQAKLQQRFPHGLDFLLTYTWGKAVDNGEGGMGVSNNYNLRESHGPASWDRTHTVTLTHTWDLPLGKGRRWALGHNAIGEALLGGWRFSGVHEFASGLPFTPVVVNAPLLNADFNYVRADVVGNPNVAHPNRNLWFNTAAYSEPRQPFRNGTASRNSLRGPTLALSNLSIAKNLPLMEGKSLELRADAFNVFNHVNLGLPSAYIDYFGAGQITSVQTPMRQMQFGLHLQF